MTSINGKLCKLMKIITDRSKLVAEYFNKQKCHVIFITIIHELLVNLWFV